MKKTTKSLNQPHREDAEVLNSIKRVIRRRKTYGYSRVTSLINHARKQQAISPVNHKRVYRIMRDNRLLLAKHGKKSTHTHDGKIITLNSNMRW